MKTLIRLFKFFFTLVILALLLYFSHSVILDKAARYLYYKDELKPADAIVILAGEETERVEYGVKLFKEGWARKDKVILSGGPLVWKYSWAALMKNHALSLGVPDKAILLEDQSTNTEEKARFTKDILQKHGYASCILVTSPYQSRRAFNIFKKVMGDSVTIISAPSEESWFRFEEWWKRKKDRATVLAEFSKFFWFWIYRKEE